MGPRRILLVIAGLPAGGAERQMALLARHLDRERFIPGLLIFGRRERVHYTEVFDRTFGSIRSNSNGVALPQPCFGECMRASGVQQPLSSRR
jgi:hypothetical protein